jgi:DNA polymerase-1
VTEKVLLAVDLSFQTYRAVATHQNLSSADNVFTGGLYGFLVSLASTIRDTKATRVVVCCDTKPYKRSAEYPDYKQLRKSSADPKLKEQVLVSLEQIKRLLHVVGIPVVAEPGFESDDLIAHFVHTHRGRFNTIFAASNDSDLYQLFWCPWFRVYRKDLSSVMDRTRLLAETGLLPYQFMLASALQGTHNDIEGIPRVGPATAAKAVKDPGILRTYTERYGALIERNLRLIRLPHKDFPRQTPLPSVASFDLRALYRFCARYDIEVTSTMLNSFEQVSA